MSAGLGGRPAPRTDRRAMSSCIVPWRRGSVTIGFPHAEGGEPRSLWSFPTGIRRATAATVATRPAGGSLTATRSSGGPSPRRSEVGYSMPGHVPGQEHAVGKRRGLHQVQVHPVVHGREEGRAAAHQDRVSDDREDADVLPVTESISRISVFARIGLLVRSERPALRECWSAMSRSHVWSVWLPFRVAHECVVLAMGRIDGRSRCDGDGEPNRLRCPPDAG
jgi:hypothetical protein